MVLPRETLNSMNEKVPSPGLRWGAFLASLPAFRGKLRMIDAAALLKRISGGNENTVCLWPGAPFFVDLRDRIHREMWAGCYEPHVMRSLRAILRPGDIFVDIGAHIGYHSYFAAGLVGPCGAVYAFEADPGAFERLKHNLGAFSTAHALNLAIWDQNVELWFERSSTLHESGWGSLTAVRDTHHGEHIIVAARSLDAWNSSEGLPALRLIKLDAEGSELKAVFGARNLLRRFRPVIVMELNGILLRQAGWSAVALQEFLRKEHYVMCRIEFAKLSEIPVPVEFDLADAVVFPEEHLQEMLDRFRDFGFRITSALHGQRASTA